MEKLFRDGADGSDDLANHRNQTLEFYHVATGRSVRFKAFLTVFQDSYSSDWNDEAVFGRMDPISTFKATQRKISLGWVVPSGSEEEAVENLKLCSILFSLLYPTYDDDSFSNNGGGSSTINSGPLFKLKFMNLIQNASAPGLRAQESGLLGKISGFAYEPDLEQGFFDGGPIIPSPFHSFSFSCCFYQFN